MKYKLFFLLLLLPFFGVVFAQNDAVFIYHQAAEGETFQTLEQIYGVSQTAIKSANPQLSNALKTGELVRIPYDKSLINNGKQSKNSPSVSSTTTIINTSISTAPAIADSLQSGRYHEVKPKETLWGISHKYNVTIDALVAANPFLKDGLKIGQVVVIPDKEQETVVEVVVEDTTQLANYHIVTAGETMYSIAKMHRVALDSLSLVNPQVINYHLSIGDTLMIPNYLNTNDFIEHKSVEKEKVTKIAFNYQTTIRELQEANPKLPKTVKAGEVVKIPVTPYEEIENQVDTTVQTVSEVPTETVVEAEILDNSLGCWNKESVFQIALMMPFHTEEIERLSEENLSINTSAKDYPFFQYYPFYQSVILALESLTLNDLHFELHVFDVADGNRAVDKILRESMLSQMDLIIGFLYFEPYLKVAEFAQNHNITLINVSTRRDDVVNGFPNTVKVMPAQSEFATSAILVLPDDINSFHLSIVCQKNADFEQVEREIRQAFSRKYPNAYLEPTYFSNYDLAQNLRSDKPHYVMALNQNKASIMDLLRILDKKRKQFDVHIIGYPEWETIDNLDVNHLQHLNAIFVTPYFVDYQSEQVLQFVQKFREKYNADPDSWAFQGYDITAYFVEGLTKFGKKFLQHLEQIEYQPMSNEFQFKKSADNGWINQHWNVYTIEDYVPVKLH